MRRGAIALCLLVGLSLTGTAQAQDAIKIVVPFAAGGPVDTAARLLAEGMQGPLGTNIVIENRGGGGGVIAADLVARAPADGKTLLMGSQGAHVISAVLQPHVRYDPAKSFEPIAMLGSVPTLLIVNRDLPAKTLAGRARQEPEAQLWVGGSRHDHEYRRRADQRRRQDPDCPHPLSRRGARHS